MTARSKERFRSRSAAEALGGDDARRAWVTLLSLAAQAAADAQAARHRSTVEAAPLAGWLKRLAPASGPLGARFPVRKPSAEAAAEAFLILTRAFVGAGWTPALAASVAACAADLLALIEADTQAAFRRSCAVAGGDD